MNRLRRRPYLLAGVVVALIVVLAFGGRAAWRLGHRLLGPPPPPRQTDVSLIADWMSVPYIGRAYRVPEPELYRALGVEPAERRVRPLRVIARDSERSTDEVLTIVRETVSAWQEAHPGPPTPIGAPSPPPLVPPKPKDGGPGGPRPPP
ncbi:MAG TPA: hypothetical protein VFH48_04075 [Chloroflexota bacterium]|nr:hypothetical protein [Chloroflexota bacterium]